MATCSFLCILVAITICGAVPTYRLPGDVLPRHYDLEVFAHLDEKNNFTFTGTVTIQLDIVRETKAIILHSKELTIDRSCITVLANNKVAVPITNITYDKPVDFLIIHVEEALEPGSKCELSISFSGLLLEGLIGFYRSSYKDAKGEKVWLATTQFESTYARRAFPCFDEPAMKATFTITIGRKEGLTAISNMPLEESKAIDGMKGWYWDSFQKSVPMSTYLLAYIISDFEFVESAKQKNNVLFKIWARKDAIGQTKYASEVGPKVLSYFEDYYDVPYPLPKQDMVAIPDFGAGAMENWGIITYRETALLYSNKTSSSTSKARVASVVAHELAHQWFGNLVTMDWWTDLWLNEGFATYMATLGVNHVEPDWNVLEEESADNLVDVFKLDSLDSSHPVSVPIGEPAEIAQIFDAISYKKGSAIIRMMNLFLGERVFRDGVSNYLKKYKYKNAEQDHLWQSLTDAAHKSNALPKDYSVKEIMDSWTKQTGYPLITVTRDYNRNTAHVSQHRHQEKYTSPQNQTWWVPLSYWSSDTPKPQNQTPSSWLTADQSKVLRDFPGKDQWVLFNIDMAGVYRVTYDIHNWNLLKEALAAPSHSGISVLNRFQLIADAMALAWSKQLPYHHSLNMLKYLKEEKAYLPWKAALSGLGKINYLLMRSPTYGTFKKYMRELLTPQYLAVGGLHSGVISTPGRLDAVKHQVLISSWSCKMGVDDCEKNARDLFKKWMDKENPDEDNPVPNDLRNIVYCRGIASGGEKEWEFLWQRYIKSNVASEKDSILTQLGCTNDVWLLNRLLELSITKDSEIRKQDAHSAFGAVAYGQVGYYVARDFLYSRIKDISKYHKTQLVTLGRYVKTIASQITTGYESEEFTRWVENNKPVLQESNLSVKQALETISLNLEWIEEHGQKIVEVLQGETA